MYYACHISFKNSNRTTLIISIPRFNNARDSKMFGMSYSMYLVKNCLLYIVYARLKKAGISDKVELQYLTTEADKYITYEISKANSFNYEVDAPDTYYIDSDIVKEYSKRILKISNTLGFKPLVSPQKGNDLFFTNVWFLG